MTLQQVVSGANLTAVRSGSYWAEQFVVFVPDVVVVQFQPSADAADVYAEIAVGSVGSGSMSNIKSYQTVIYSTSTDYGATETYRNYVRKVSGTSVLYVGENAQELTTAMYVTVLLTYENFELPRTERNGTIYNNWDKSFRRVLPVETALPSAIVLIDGTTAWTPTAAPLEIDANATSTFTHAWESSNSNDSLDSGGTTASPSWTLEAAAHRWIRYTFTDSNGNAGLRIIPVWTVPKDMSSVVTLGFVGSSGDVADISGGVGREWTCTIGAYKNISTIRKGTFICVFSIETINDVRGSIFSNIDAVGYLGEEVTDTRGDQAHGFISETRFDIDTLSRKLSQTSITIIRDIIDTASPSTWDEIEAPTPVRALVYLLSEFTTYLQLCAFNPPTNHTDYQAPGEFFGWESSIALDAIRYQAEAMGAIIQFGRDGILDMTQNLVELDDTARNAADTIVNMTPADWISYRISRQSIPTIRFMVMFAGSYDTSEDDYYLMQSFTPPIADIRGITEEEFHNIVLTNDLTNAQAQAEFAERSSNRYAALNPTDILEVDFKDEWGFLTPDVGAWYKHSVALTDTVRGIVYDTNTRWQLIDMSYAINNETGRKVPRGSFRKETQSTGANIDVAALETDPLNEINAVPGVLPPFTGGNLELTDGNWFDGLDFAPPSLLPPPASADCEVIGWRPSLGLGTETDRAALSGENVDITVQGSGRLQTGSSVDNDFTAGAGTWVTVSSTDSYGYANNGLGAATDDIASGSTGTYTGGTGFVHGDVDSDLGTKSRIALILIDLGAIVNVTDMELTYDFTKGAYSAGGNPAIMIRYSTTAALLSWTNAYDLSFTSSSSGTGLTATFTNANGVQARYVQMFARSSFNAGGGGYSGAATLKAATITGDSIYGDALYFWTPGGTPEAYDTDKGLLINAAQPSSIPPFNANHQYSLPQRPISGSGAVALDFESPYSLSSMENFAFQAEVCFLGVP